MTSRARLEAAVQGRKADRPAFGFWYHFRPLDWFPPALREEYCEERPDDLAIYVEQMPKATLEFWHRYRPDLLKVMHDAPYESSGIASAEDWRQLRRLGPTQGNFGAHLEVLRQIRAGLPNDVPMIETVFNAQYYANKLCGKRLSEHLRDHPEAVAEGISVIYDNLEAYAREAIKITDGIYFAVNGASEDTGDPDTYKRYFQERDRRLLESASSAPFNVLHLHGYGELYGELVADMPAAIYCWSDRASNLSLSQGSAMFKRCVMGGINEMRLPEYGRREIATEAADALHQETPYGFVLAPGCAVATDAPEDCLRAIGEIASELLSEEN
ncbi:MAG: hypothetical protein HUU60_02995 [Armatimonadetes bacterium]|nr:hypothetical protein [Armatimonadota bacterium]